MLDGNNFLHHTNREGSSSVKTGISSLWAVNHNVWLFHSDTWSLNNTKVAGIKILRVSPEESPGGAVIRTLSSHCWRPRFNPWLGKQDPTSYMAKKREREREEPERVNSPHAPLKADVVSFLKVWKRKAEESVAESHNVRKTWLVIVDFEKERSLGAKKCRSFQKLEDKNRCFPQSVQFSHSVVSDSLRTHGLQLARLPCPSPTSGDCSNSCPSSRLPRASKKK